MWVLPPPAACFWPVRVFPAGPEMFPDSPQPARVRPPDWELLLLFRLAACYWLKLPLPFFPERCLHFRCHQGAAKKKADSVRERQSRCWAGWCSGCRRRAFSLPLCG